MIIQAPNEILSQKAMPVEKIDRPVLNLIAKMKRQLLAARDPEGVGLAAPQIGENLQLFIIKLNPKSPIKVLINPKIVKIDKTLAIFTKERLVQKSRSKRKKEAKRLEGCLSVKNIWGEVMRSPSLVLSYTDEKGGNHKQKFEGFLATIIQHEFDHTNGVLFTQRVLEQKGKLYKSYKDKKGEDVFEEIKLA